MKNNLFFLVKDGVADCSTEMEQNAAMQAGREQADETGKPVGVVRYALKDVTTIEPDPDAKPKRKAAPKRKTAKRTPAKKKAAPKKKAAKKS